MFNYLMLEAIQYWGKGRDFIAFPEFSKVFQYISQFVDFPKEIKYLNWPLPVKEAKEMAPSLLPKICRL